jgi:RNA polymerase sigma factor (sigma-70 family)
MHYCQVCQQQAAVRNSLLCIACFKRQCDTFVWPQVRAILPAVDSLCHYTDPRVILQARRTFFTALEQIPVESNYPPSALGISQEQMVQQATTLWTAYFKAVRQYTEQVARESPAWEFLIQLKLARQQCTRYRAILWTHWRFDVEQRGWRSGYFPITATARADNLRTFFNYVNHQNLFYSGVLTLVTTLQGGSPLLEALREAAQMMRTTELESITQDFIALMSVPRQGVQDWATAQCAGWVRAQILVFGKKGTSLRMALQEHQISAAQFREYLFAWVSQSYHEGMITPSTLLADVRRRAGRVRNTERPRGRPRAANTTIHDVSIAREAPYALDALAQQRARREAHRTLSAAKERVGLSPQETRVWEMRHEEGLSYKEIAAREAGITEGAVGSILDRAKKKMQKAPP